MRELLHCFSLFNFAQTKDENSDVAIFFYENDESGVGCCNGARAYYNVKHNIIGPTVLHIYYTLRRSGGQILRQ